MEMEILVENVVFLDDFRKKKNPPSFSEKTGEIKSSLEKLDEGTKFLFETSQELLIQSEIILKKWEELLKDVESLAKKGGNGGAC